MRLLSWLQPRSDVLQYLVEQQGADRDKVNNQGTTVLMFAAGRGRLRVVRYLVEQGSDKDKANNFGATALMWAAQYGHYEVAEFLLEDGVDLTKTAIDGATALHAAALRGHAEILSLLMAYGASLTTKMNDGRLPIDMAANDAIRVLIHDEPSRRMDHGYKRDPNLAIPDPDAEQASKRPRLEGEEEGPTSAFSTLTAEELKYQEEVNEDSASSDEEEISKTKINRKRISSDKKSV